MKTIFTILLICLFADCYSQTSFKKTVRIAFMGNSHCNGAGATTDDSSYRGRIVSFLKTKYDTVLVSKLCNGGETTTHAMPSWWPGYSTTVNIDTALKFNPDFIFMEYSGNDLVVLNMNTTQTINNYRFLMDTISKKGIRAFLTGYMPRQKTFANGLTQQGYKDTSLLINSVLSSAYYESYMNAWDSLLRSDNSGKMKVEYLYSDSLHMNNTGHYKAAQTMLNSPAMDALACNCKGRALDFALSKVGDSVRVYASDIVAGRVELYGSNDLNTYVLLNYWRMPTGVFDKKHYGNTYTYYQVRILSGFRPTMTKTKQIN